VTQSGVTASTSGTPQGLGPVIQCPKAWCLPTGLTPGQKIAIRLAVNRKTQRLAYSEAINATVRRATK